MRRKTLVPPCAQRGDVEEEGGQRPLAPPQRAGTLTDQNVVVTRALNVRDQTRQMGAR